MRPSRLMTAVVPKQKRNEPSHVYRYVRTGTDSIQTIKYPCKPNKIKSAVRNVGASRPASLRFGRRPRPRPRASPGADASRSTGRDPNARLSFFFFSSSRAIASDSTGDADADARECERIETNSDGRAVSASVISGSSSVNRATRHRDGRTDVCCFNSFARFVSSARSRRNRNAREGRVVDSIRLCGRRVRFSTDSRNASHRIDTEGNDGARCG